MGNWDLEIVVSREIHCSESDRKFWGEKGLLFTIDHSGHQIKPLVDG